MCVCVCGQVDVNTAARFCFATISSLILLLLDGLREVLITGGPQGFARSKRSKLNLKREDGTTEGLKMSVWREALGGSGWLLTRPV